MVEVKKKKITRKISFEKKNQKLILSIEMQNIELKNEKINDFLEVMFKEIVSEISFI